MKIAVAGATGRVGRHVVEVLRTKGHEVVGISRASGVDVVTGKGLPEALAGVECIIDAASGPSPEEQAAAAFFTAAAMNLQRVGAHRGVRRIVVVSIIGIDRFKHGYMAAKVAHERASSDGPIPVRILRAAQFHEFVGQLLDWGRRGDVSYLPKMRTQLVAARTVAEALVELATSSDFGAAPRVPILEIAGPRAESLVEVAEKLVARRGDRVKVVGVSDPADPDHELYESGALLPGPNATLAGPTFDAWLAAGGGRP